MRFDQNYWMLDGKTPVRALNLIEWGTWMEIGDRRVAEDFVGSVRVSTVFLGLNHQFGDGPPILFETMVFGGVLDDLTCRYSTWDEAEKGHQAILEQFLAKARLN